MDEYSAVQQRLAQGWNTWNTRSVLSHVLLPAGFALNLGIKEYTTGAYLKEALIGRKERDEEHIHPGPRTYDGGYTELRLQWRSVTLLVQSAVIDGDQLLLVTPEPAPYRTPLLVAEAGFLWNREGTLLRDGETLIGQHPGGEVRVYATRASVAEPYIAAQTPYLALLLDGPVGLCTGTPRTVAEITSLITQRQEESRARAERFGELAEVYTATQTCLAWDTVYDPLCHRVVSPVSRLWNCGWGGYVLFDWDQYFAALLAAIDNKDLAYANAVEITREKTEAGFVPNFATPTGCKSRDRSEPPVGALAVLLLYRRYGDRWLLEELYDDLLAWNRWWAENRRVGDLYCWGSTPYLPVVGNQWELNGVNERLGAALESGLDNSPMYDDIPFNSETHLLALADVGLTSLCIKDCRALVEIADVLGRADDARMLRARAERTTAALQTLWNDATGIFCNRRTDTGEFNFRLSPTNFYPLLARAATNEQAARMIREHLLNPAEFWGDWVLPSIARNDPAFHDQDYWRGRIWGPMNFLIYLALREYDFPEVRAQFADKSRALLLKEWRAHGHVHENYHAESGEGCDSANSDCFYHWGGLLGLIALMETGEFAEDVP